MAGEDGEGEVVVEEVLAEVTADEAGAAGNEDVFGHEVHRKRLRMSWIYKALQERYKGKGGEARKMKSRTDTDFHGGREDDFGAAARRKGKKLNHGLHGKHRFIIEIGGIGDLFLGKVL